MNGRDPEVSDNLKHSSEAMLRFQRDYSAQARCTLMILVSRLIVSYTSSAVLVKQKPPRPRWGI